jgi:hypothetical protein
MGMAKTEMLEAEDQKETANILLRMVELLAEYPSASIRELEQRAIQAFEEEERDADLARLMEKDD